MIKFFRKIRQNLLNQGKTSKYFKYAIGEIVLVVIGILIALQINNWNEERKDNVEIKNTLLALKYDLVKDSLLISKHLDYSDKNVETIKKMHDKVKHQSSTVDTLVDVARYQFEYYWVTPLKFSNATLSTIQSSSLFSRLSDSLRLSITDLQNTQIYYLNLLQKNNENYLTHLTHFKENYAISIEGDSINSLAATLTWKKIDTKDFVLKFDNLVEWRYQLWLQYSNLLTQTQLRTNNLINLVDKNISK